MARLIFRRSAMARRGGLQPGTPVSGLVSQTASDPMKP